MKTTSLLLILTVVTLVQVGCRLADPTVPASSAPLALPSAHPVTSNPAPTPTPDTSSPKTPPRADTVNQSQAKLIPLKTATFEEVEPVLSPLLSSTGRLAHTTVRNAIMVYDNPANIRMIEETMAQFDPTPENIRVWVEFDEDTTSRGVSADASTPGIVIRRKRGGETRVEGEVRITGGTHMSRSDSNTRQFLMTTNNRPATLWVGKTVANPVWVFEYGFGRGWWSNDIIYNNIGASLRIRPRIVGNNNIAIEVYPRITMEGPNPLSVKAKELSTQVTVANGGTIQLGGMDQEKREAYLRLFGVGRLFTGRRLNITLGADIVPPNPK